jgi:hypothetical protein
MRVFGWCLQKTQLQPTRTEYGRTAIGGQSMGIEDPGTGGSCRHEIDRRQTRQNRNGRAKNEAAAEITPTASVYAGYLHQAR